MSEFSLTPRHLLSVLPLASRLTAALASEDSLLPNVSLSFSTLLLAAEANAEHHLPRSCPHELTDYASALAYCPTLWHL